MDSPSLQLDLNNLTCRVCLGSFDTSNSLYDFVEYEERIELKDVLKRVANVLFELDEMGPTRICSDCTDRLLNAYELVCQVEKSESLLQNYMKQEKKHDGADSILSQKENFPVKIDEEIVENEDFEILDEEFQILPDNGQECYTKEITRDSTENELETVDYILKSEADYFEIKNMDSNNSPDLENKEILIDDVTKDKEICSASYKYAEIESREELLANLSNTIQCDQCNRKFAKDETLKRHMKVAHTYAPPEKIAAIVALAPNSPKELFTCMHCPRTFARKDNLKRHLQVVHQIKFLEENKQKKQHIYKRGLCPYCGESFSSASLIVHIRRHTGETPYKCTECNKGFPRRQDLTIHQRKHTGERPHVCTVCGKSFSRPNKLTRHMRVHTGERPYKCTECDRSFAQSNDLNIHLRRHTGEKPYKCSVCGAAFISGTALNSHRKLKSHNAEESELLIDPFEKIRVNNRRRTVVEKAVHTKIELSDDDVIQEYISE